MACILVVDDEPDLLESIRKILVRDGHEVVALGDGAAVAEHMDGVELVLTDLMMPRVDGMAVLEAVRGISADVPVVMMTAFATIDNAVAAMRAGAWDYLAKPFPPQTLRVTVTRALQHGALTTENRRLRRALGRRQGPVLVTSSPAMREVEDMIRRVAPTELTVLITGESGTGKEVVARVIHEASARANAAFVPVDCAAIPANLVESELFGHEKGAFTGATGVRHGLVEEADGGTFFLDEIGDLDLPIQTRLLRLLQEQEFRRVGGAKMLRADIRVVAATNRDLEAQVTAGKFREDLYHRLNVVRVRLPPLRDRKEEVPALLDHFVDRFRHETGRAAFRLAPALLARLVAHDWPGNVRELANVARYLVGLARGPEATCDDLPPSFRAAAPVALPAEIRFDLPYKEAKRLWVERFDEAYIPRLLDAHGGNVSAAARTAEFDRKSIQRILQRGPEEDDASEG